MYTNRQAIYDVKHLADRHHISKDNGLSDVFIFDTILLYRSKLIKERVVKNMELSKFLYQDTPCLRLIEVPKDECECGDIDSNCTVYRTERPLPKSLTPIKEVTNTLRTKQYAKVDSSKVRFRKRTKYKSINNKEFYYTSDRGDGEYLYIVSNNPILTESKIIVNSVWEDPREIQKMINCNDEMQNKCTSYYDLEFICDKSLFAIIQEMIVKNWVTLKLKLPTDQVADQTNTK